MITPRCHILILIAAQKTPLRAIALSEYTTESAGMPRLGMDITNRSAFRSIHRMGISLPNQSLMEQHTKRGDILALLLALRLVINNMFTAQPGGILSLILTKMVDASKLASHPPSHLHVSSLRLVSSWADVVLILFGRHFCSSPFLSATNPGLPDAITAIIST